MNKHNDEKARESVWACLLSADPTDDLLHTVARDACGAIWRDGQITVVDEVPECPNCENCLSPLPPEAYGNLPFLPIQLPARPDWPDYFLGITRAVRDRADCMGRKVGAIAVKNFRIVSTGYNGTPSGHTNCTEGGCERCADPDRKAGEGYEFCWCVHGEQNALLYAARYGVSLDGAAMYVVGVEPCLNCLKEMVVAGVREVITPEGSTILSEPYIGRRKASG